jgi:hypothetical protein
MHVVLQSYGHGGGGRGEGGSAVAEMQSRPVLLVISHHATTSNVDVPLDIATAGQLHAGCSAACTGSAHA